MSRTRLVFAAVFSAALLAAPAFAASDQEPGKHDTAKGAAVGAVAGHELGSGHAAAGAAVGAGVGHHEKKKAERNSSG